LLEEDLALLNSVQAERTIVVLNKKDLPSHVNIEALSRRGFRLQQVSVLQDTGIEDLKDQIEAMFTSGLFQPNTTFITNQRHYQALETAVSVFKSVHKGWGALPFDLLAMDLREGWHILGEITGSVWSENLLDCIFARFCLGK